MLLQTTPNPQENKMSDTPKPTESPAEHTLQAASEPQIIAKPAGSKRKRNLLVLTVVLLAIAAGFSAMYLLVWQHEVETDDSYVGGHLIQVTPQINGTVNVVAVDDTDTVKAGQVLVELDADDAQLAYERAKSELANAAKQNQQLSAGVRQASAQIAVQQANLKKAQADLARRMTLAGTDAISDEEIAHARSAVEAAQAGLTAAHAQEQQSKAALGRESLREQPAVQTAMSHMKDAWLNLERTHIKAASDGQVARRNVQVGQKVAAGSPLMAIGPPNTPWVDAKFKENQLSKLRLGQPVSLVSDLYGDKVVFHGKVLGLSAGTGSAFSVLPAQNATGNWIKVVQRVPVRIQLDAKELAEHPLRIGLSMKATVDISNQQGAAVATATVKDKTLATAAATDRFTDVDAAINSILSSYEH